MSESDRLSTEDLAGRQVPDESHAGTPPESPHDSAESTAPGAGSGGYDAAPGAGSGGYDAAPGAGSGGYDAAPGAGSGGYATTAPDSTWHDTATDPTAPGTVPAPPPGEAAPADEPEDEAGLSASEGPPGERNQQDDDQDDDDVSLVNDAQAGQFRDRWSGVQTRFVDDPRAAVGAADALVAELMQTLAAGFADHKSRLETQWQGGGEPDTEELRLALRRYRVFFQRLLQT